MGRFVIQEHHARRLHWDFRLEHEGVLASWALPKGVPTDTAHNHLAVQTEDHPLEYGAFEGTIPKGEYGAGEVTIWDSGHFVAEKWRDDEVIAVLDGQRARGRFALIRTHEANWLIHRMRDQEPDGAGDSSTDEPPDYAPMLATAGSLDDLARGDWQLEGKWDGMRAVVSASADGVRAHSRAGNDITARFPEIDELATTLGAHRAVLDGELVALGDDGVPSFGLLQQRMGLTGAREIERASADVPVHYYVFDLLWLNGIALTGKAVEDRRLLLERLRLASDHCAVPPTLRGSPAAAFDLARENSWEGIVAKRVGSKYRPGQRSKDWLKVKLLAMQAVVIVGYRPGQGRRADQVGSLLMAIPESDELCYAGRVGTGFTDAELESLSDQLKPLERKTSPVAATVPHADARDAVWVTPRLVGEVTATEITHDGRLRQPSWRGLRPDLQVDQVTREI